MKKRSGIKLLNEVIGTGEEIQRLKWYQMSLKIWLPMGEPIKWSKSSVVANYECTCEHTISEDDQTVTGYYRYDRISLFFGLLYGIEGMRIGGKRTLKISPHLAYGKKGVEGIIPPNAALKVEVEILGERKFD